MEKKYSGKRGAYSLLVGMLVFSLIFSAWLALPVQDATLNPSSAQAASKKISGGMRHSLAVTSEGKVVAWGSKPIWAVQCTCRLARCCGCICRSRPLLGLKEQWYSGGLGIQ